MVSVHTTVRQCEDAVRMRGCRGQGCGAIMLKEQRPLALQGGFPYTPQSPKRATHSPGSSRSVEGLQATKQRGVGAGLGHWGCHCSEPPLRLPPVGRCMESFTRQREMLLPNISVVPVMHRGAR
jgi:hypothetical protein